MNKILIPFYVFLLTSIVDINIKDLYKYLNPEMVLHLEAQRATATS